MTQEVFSWVDPRSDPVPPYRGPERKLASSHEDLAELVMLCKEGRFYEIESWVAVGNPLQVDPDMPKPRRRVPTLLAVALDHRSYDLVRLFLCNGYRIELEPDSPLNAALEIRRWDILDLLLGWGADPQGADVWRILDTYHREVFERFWNSGVDLCGDGAMTDALATSTSNRPLYGFVKNYRERDSRIQRALDIALGSAVNEKNEKAMKLCRWSGADSRRQIGEKDDPPEDDEWGMTAIERAVAAGASEYLKALGFDPSIDRLQSLYDCVSDLDTLRILVGIEPPEDWAAITKRFIGRLAMSISFSFHFVTTRDLEGVFELGGYLGSLDRQTKRELRQILLSVSEYEMRNLLRLLRDPENMDPTAFIDLIAHEKLAARYSDNPRRYGFDKSFLSELAAAPRVPGPVRRWAKLQIAPSPRRVVSHTYFQQVDGPRCLLSRDDLYELVWSEPILSLAKRFGLSDNGLRKRCKTMLVPTPPAGYWQKKKSGQKVKRPPLPELRGG